MLPDDPASPATASISWHAVRRAVNRPYPVTRPMILLVALVPFYIFIAAETRGRNAHVPALAWDARFPLEPAWVLVYGPLYLFLILLPVFVVTQQEHIRRTVNAYLAVWIVSYIVFLLYPTRAMRPESFAGSGFIAWALRALYSMDPPFNCFPSIHVAHSVVSALTAHRVHRGVGRAAFASALLVGVSTLFTKQHYILDVVVGIALAAVAFHVCFRGYRGTPTATENRVAPYLALIVVAVVALLFACYLVIYLLGIEP